MWLRASVRRAAAAALAARHRSTRVLSSSYASSSFSPSAAAAANPEAFSPSAAAAADPEAFWSTQAAALDWFKPPTRAAPPPDAPAGSPWFAGGVLNTSHLCLDAHVASGRADADALHWHSPATGGEATLTYAQLRDRVADIAGRLAALGVEKGDRVVVYLPMIVDAVAVMLACARLGAVHSVVFGGFAPAELAARIDDAAPKVVVTAAAGVEANRVLPYKPLVDAALDLARHEPKAIVVIPREDLPPDEGADCAMRRGRDFWLWALPGSPAECVPVLSEDPLYVLYTSGTTGRPKGVMRPNGGHAVVLQWSMKHVMGLQPGETYWAASDVGWVVGHSYITYAPLLAGNATVVYEGKPVGTPDAGAWWRLVEKHQVRGLFSAPTAFRALRKADPRGEFLRHSDLSSLRNVFVAGERCDPATLKWLEDVLPDGVRPRDQWWSTESGSAIAANPAGPHGDLGIKYGSCGLPMPGHDLRVLGEDGAELAPGKVGTLALKLPLAPSCLAGLYNNEERFKSSYLEDYAGFLNTNDSGSIDEDGYVWVEGRTDDIINVAAHRLSSVELEEAVGSHEAVAEVAVIGVPDDLKGEVPAAFYVPKADKGGDAARLEAEIIERVRARVGPVASMRAAVRVPRLPKTRSGKVLRKAMRALLERGEVSPVPSTIEDPGSLDDIRAALKARRLGPWAEALLEEGD